MNSLLVIVVAVALVVMIWLVVFVNSPDPLAILLSFACFFGVVFVLMVRSR